MKLKRTRLGKSLWMAFGGTAMCATAAAQDVPQTQQLERVEITGSAIRRIDAETAVPVTVLKVDELKKQGITTVEQVLANITAVQVQQGTSQVIGAGTGGASFADLRGIGQNKTLVLLNGRRIANNAIDSSAPDLNTIPFAALERVEVLRDGASALYGTDAIGGVINFITRRSYVGGTATLGFDMPEHSGGKNYNVNLGYGFGDLDKDRYNIYGFVDYQKQDPITGSQRTFGANGKTSPTTFPGVYFQNGDSVNPAAPACVGTYLKPSDATNCVYNPNLWIDYIPKSERISGMLKGAWQLADDHRANLEYFVTQSTVWSTIAPVPFGGLTVSPGTPFYPGNGITPAPPASVGIDPTQPVDVRFRDEPNGGRKGQTINLQQRFVASLEGNIAGWDYQAGLTYNENKITDKLVGGYTNGDVITQGVADGIINPFGDQTAAGAALLASAEVNGTLQNAKGTVYGVDARASREVGDWFGAGRPSALALGAEYRREKFSDVGNAPYDQIVIASTGFDPATNNVGSRNVTAVYAELNVPLLSTLEVTGAVRYDRYSDFGNTTNPKVSFRFQPMERLLFRGAYSTGFRAPSLFDLFAAQTYTNTPNTWDDPVRCPNGNPLPGLPRAANCGVQFMSLTGGNTTLKPEKAKDWTFGLVFEPIADASVGLDFWWIRLKQQINPLDDNTVFGDPTKFASLFHRAPDGSLSTDGSQCPGADCGYVELITQNLGGINTNGVDLSASYRLRAGDIGTFNFALNSTYVTKFEYQTEAGGPWIQNVGVYSGTGPIFRWQHTFNTTWTQGPYSAGLTGHYKSGYADEFAPNQVPSYTTWDLYGAWQPTKQITLTLGVRNVFDRDPPFSNQAFTFQQGYDPRFADPTGRTWYARGNYSF
ncbi:MAG: TonB-dependent receptor [Proteobacteria bacterium]|nr:TonB-dependent receptor [Pseudomonadota bacterium]